MHDEGSDDFDVVVVGGGPAGATAARTLAEAGRSVLLLDAGGRIKPCGGAIPPRLVEDYGIPPDLIVARATAARMVSPADQRVDIPIRGGYVGMVDRGPFDAWLRERAGAAGAVRRRGRFEALERQPDGRVRLHYQPGSAPATVEHDDRGARGAGEGPSEAGRRSVTARYVIGADGARSAVARQSIRGADRLRCVYAYHEIVRAPDTPSPGYDGARCDVVYRGSLSPDFYGWVFPHGPSLSIGIGSADRGHSLRGAVTALRAAAGLGTAETLRREGAPLPLGTLRRWDDGRHVVLAGDAAGAVAPTSGEGIYYAMESGRCAAETVDYALQCGEPQVLALARQLFMQSHGRVFWMLGLMQRFWYSSDRRRERFVSICRDRDVQTLTFEAYMTKRMRFHRPGAHLRIFCKDVAHLLGLAPL